MVVEDRYYRDAIRRSRELAAGQWGRIVVVSLLTGLLTLGASVVTGVVAGLVEFTYSSPTGPGGGGEAPLAVLLLEGLLNAGIQTVIAPLTTVLGVLLYFDVRVRKEGFDIDLLAQEMGTLPSSGDPYTAPA
jgi:hypothetical protein